MTYLRESLLSRPMARGMSDQKRQAFADRLKKAADAKGLQQADIIRRLSEKKTEVTAASVSQWFGGKHVPGVETRLALVEVLGVTDDYLMGRVPPDDMPLPASPPLMIGGARDLPVYGAAEGGDGVMILDNEPIEYAARPDALIGVRGAFAIYAVNDSMAPAYEQGDKVYVHPGRPLKPGSDALFIREDKDGTRHAMIKRLVRVTDKAWKVKQFNPDKTFDLPRSIWQKAQRIVGSYRAD